VAIPADYHNGSDYVSGAGDVLSGKTFTNGSSVGASGAMPDKGGSTIDAGGVSQDDNYTYFFVPANGYYNTSSRIRAANSNIFQNSKIKVYRTSLKMSKAGNSITIGSDIQRIIYFHMDSRKSVTVNYSPIFNCKLNDDGTVTFSVKCTNTDVANPVYIYGGIRIFRCMQYGDSIHKIRLRNTC